MNPDQIPVLWLIEGEWSHDVLEVDEETVLEWMRIRYTPSPFLDKMAVDLYLRKTVGLHKSPFDLQWMRYTLSIYHAVSRLKFFIENGSRKTLLFGATFLTLLNPHNQKSTSANSHNSLIFI